ncbi:response regulator transcription factor [Enterococcus faecium]|uniref:response regulator transcription factor n=1 Tax=Enterococcus TaxID=1350 RepID=UPI00235FE1D8|nr:response regulator transcription factor [Enterococcus faecalis]MDK4459548.1 response regulator transcription factor [Enterococcus faecalis]MDT2166541.1 response regulator transcription factor [Enterococcus faecalis]WDA19759.1 response regulator transcription factor [Enterococcus faecalis]
MTQQANILVVEDNQDINQLLCKIIRKHHGSAQPVYSGTEAMIYIEKQEWDLVLLDLMLPGMSGEDVLNELSQKSAVPVIIISARGEQQSKIDCLRTGADDYITKPFDVEEVSARIHAQLRRNKRNQVTLLKKELIFKDIVIDLEAKMAWANGTLLKLTAKEFTILVLFVSNPRKIYSKPNLYESVWKEPYYGDENIVNVHMSHLRSKLAQVNPDETYIETVWGMGYRLKN